MPEQPCKVSVTVDAGLEVSAKSLYGPVFAYNAEPYTWMYCMCPRLTPDMALEVKLAAGRQFTTTLKKSRDWVERDKGRCPGAWEG